MLQERDLLKWEAELRAKEKELFDREAELQNREDAIREKNKEIGNQEREEKRKALLTEIALNILDLFADVK